MAFNYINTMYENIKMECKSVQETSEHNLTGLIKSKNFNF